MWFVNYAKNELWKLDNNSNIIKKEEISAKWNSKFKWVNKMVVGDNHILFLSTRQGLIIYDPTKQSIREINMIDGLPSNLIEALYYYKHHLYASTQNGLAIINTNDYSIQILNNTNGINEDITTRGIYLDTVLNTLFIGGKACVYKIDLSNFFSNINLPEIVLDQLKLNNKIVPLDKKEYIFKYFENNLSLLMSSIDFNSGQHKQYFYLLTVNGTKSIWTKNIGKQLNLLNLSPGNYTLQIKSKNSKNQWSSNSAFFKFTILKPWYNRSWFYLVCILLLGYVVYAIYLNKINQLKKLYNVRDRLSRDLHDDIGSTLSSINILSRTAQNNLSQSHNIKTIESLEKINDRSQRLLMSMSDIIWSVNPHNDTLDEVMSRMREYATTILEAKAIEYTFEFPEIKDNYLLSMELKNNMYLIFKEAVNNSSKYANPSLIKFSLIFNEKNIHLTIEDDGKGFDESSLSHVRGLNNMRYRAKEIKANLEINSIPGEGTKISLIVPIHY